MSRLFFPDPPLSDGVVTLRRWREDDVEQIVEAVADRQVKRYTSSIPDPYAAADARHWFATHDRNLDRELSLAVVSADDERALLGAVGIHDVSWQHRRADTGYWVAAPERGRGVATRAVKLLCDWAFGEFGFARIGLYADVGNAASQRVAERAGFVREGVVARYLVMAGESRDCAVYGLTAALTRRRQ